VRLKRPILPPNLDSRPFQTNERSCGCVVEDHVRWFRDDARADFGFRRTLRLKISTGFRRTLVRFAFGRLNRFQTNARAVDERSCGFRRTLTGFRRTLVRFNARAVEAYRRARLKFQTNAGFRRTLVRLTNAPRGWIRCTHVSDERSCGFRRTLVRLRFQTNARAVEKRRSFQTNGFRRTLVRLKFLTSALRLKTNARAVLTNARAVEFQTNARWTSVRRFQTNVSSEPNARFRRTLVRLNEW